MKKHIIIILTLILIFLGRDIFVSKGEFIGGIEVGNYLFWTSQFIKEQLLSGHLPLWNPYYFCGQPFLANPQTAVFYPFTFLFVLLPVEWAFNLDILIHLFLAAVGMYTFVYLITQSRHAALSSATVFCFCGYFMCRIFAGHMPTVHATALMPWIFYLLELGFIKKKFYYFCLTAVVLSCQVLSGEPQTSYYTVLFLIIYFAMRYATLARQSKSKIDHRLIFYFSSIFVITLCLCAVQILPSLEFTLQSDRSHKSFEFSAFMSYELRNLILFLTPSPPTFLINSNWEFGSYIGILSLILTFLGFSYAKYRKYNLIFIALLIIALIMALGKNTSVYYWLYKYLPGISVFRVPARILVMTNFLLPIGVGFGVSRLMDSPLERKNYFKMLGLLAGFVIILLVASRLYEIPLLSIEMLRTFLLIIIACVVLTLMRLPISAPIKVYVIILTLFADLFVNFAYDIPKLNANKLSTPLYYEELFTRDPSYSRVILPKNTMRAMKFKYFGLNGHAPIVTGDYFKFIYTMAAVPIDPRKRSSFSAPLFQLDTIFSSKILGAKYAVTYTREKNQKKEILIQSPDVVPRAYLVNNAIVVPDLAEQLRWIQGRDFDPQSSVLLQSIEPTHHPLTSATKPSLNDRGFVSIDQYDPGRIKLTSTANQKTYLILNELFYPGWKAFVDGKETRVVRANYLLNALALNEGKHDILFVYRPASFFIGAGISLVSLILVGLLLTRTLQSRSRCSETASL